MNLDEKEILLDPSNFETLGKDQMKKKFEGLNLTDDDISHSILEFKKEISYTKRMSLKTDEDDAIVAKKKAPKRKSKSILDIDHILHAKLTQTNNSDLNKSQRSQHNNSMHNPKTQSLPKPKLKVKRPKLTTKIINPFSQYKIHKKEESKGSPRKSIYTRCQENKANHDQKIEVLKTEMLNEEKTEITSKVKKPILTEKIINKKLKDTQPIYKRVNELVESKKHKIERLQQQEKDKKRKEEEESNKTHKKLNFDSEKFSTWIDTRKQWCENKKEKISKIKEDLKKNEEDQLKEFHHPKIDKVSEELVKKRLDKSADKVYERLYDTAAVYQRKLIKLKRDNTPDFAPSINKFVVKKSSPDSRFDKLNKTLMAYTTATVNKTSTINMDKLTSNRNNKDTELRENLINLNSQENITKSSLTEREKLIEENLSRLEREGQSDWHRTIDSINDGKKNSNEKEDVLYKINVRNTSAWDQNRENNIIYSSNKYNSIISSFVEQKKPASKKRSVRYSYFNPFHV